MSRVLESWYIMNDVYLVVPIIYGRGTEWHLPKTDESFVRPAGERR